MKGHDDEAQDKKLFGKMLKKAMPKKVTSHLKKDMKEEKKAYVDDKKLMKSMHKGMKSCGK
jgi:hypothetical protein